MHLLQIIGLTILGLVKLVGLSKEFSLELISLMSMMFADLITKRFLLQEKILHL